METISKSRLEAELDKLEIVHNTLEQVPCITPLQYQLMESAIKLSRELRATLRCFIEHY